ncbi:hypothetical protein JS528_05280 [Bifidobacterium sp. MA2]|uniref:alpha-L-rhamnosidase n=1 Tax=Bifidobacterium santillanense TaxID=2809028 RepID=A0ABS5UPH5_9BIFI|nr:alpha-L-rhamnosidase C-terminal domain-containing protein [Bifidobacterium santillanense]MBT1172774.1 hypothetical protein [Bifidobacterium santillanense]
MLLIDDRRAPVDLEPGTTPVLRWRDDAASGPEHGGDPVAYQIVVDATAAEAAAGRGAVWSSGDAWVQGDAWCGVPLDGLDMAPSRRYWASLRWRYADGFEGDWAEPVMFGTGAGRAWHASPIWGPEQADSLGNAAGWAFLRGFVRLPDKPIRWATLNATAASTRPARQFVYRMWVNGAFVGVGPTFPIGDETRYDGYDVTGLLRAGEGNAIGVIAYTMEDRRFVAQLDVCYEDGVIAHYGTGAGGAGADDAMVWRALPEPWNVYPPSTSIGTRYFEAPAEDLRADRFPRGFSRSDFDDSAWVPVRGKPAFARLAATPTDKLAAVDVHPVTLRCVTRTYVAGASAATDDIAVSKGSAGLGPAVGGASRLVGVVADFGAGYMGGIRLDLDPREPIDVVIRYGETLNGDGSVRHHLSAGNVYEERWHVTPGCGPLETWGLRVFRYVEIDVAQPPEQPSSWDEPTPTGLDERATAIGRIMSRGIGVGGALTAVALVHPGVAGAPGIVENAHGRTRTCPALPAYPGSFRSSDPALDAVWRLSAHTIKAFNGNIYADSWTRERAPYEADAWIQQRAHLALDDSPALAGYTIDWLASNRTWPTEWPLYLILTAHDAWMFTGSAAPLDHLYDRLAALLPDRYVDGATGLVIKEPGESSQMDGDLVDWPPSERDGFIFGEINTVVNALASRAYADMTDIARVLGRSDDAERFARTAARMRETIHERLYDADLGAYHDGLQVVAQAEPSAGAEAGVGRDSGPTHRDWSFAPIEHASLHASAFALAFAEVPQARVGRLAAFLKGKGMACSVYTAAAYLLGLYRAGLGAEATAMIADPRTTHSWAYMLVQDAGGTMEAWDIARKPNATYSHPWGASPAFLLPAGLTGIRPIEPGYRRFEVRPQPGEPGAAGFVPEASVVVPTPAGDIHASYRVSSEAADGDSAPAVTGRIRAARPGVGRRQVLELDLTVPSRTHADVILPSAAYRGLAPGRHHLVAGL